MQLYSKVSDRMNNLVLVEAQIPHLLHVGSRNCPKSTLFRSFGMTSYRMGHNWTSLMGNSHVSIRFLGYIDSHGQLSMIKFMFDILSCDIQSLLGQFVVRSEDIV